MGSGFFFRLFPKNTMSSEISLEFINETENNEKNKRNEPQRTNTWPIFFYFTQPIKKDEQNMNNRKNFFLPANATSQNIKFLAFFSNISIHFVFFVLTPTLSLYLDLIESITSHTIHGRFFGVFVCMWTEIFSNRTPFFCNIRKLNVQRMNPFRKLLRKPVYNGKKMKPTSLHNTMHSVQGGEKRNNNKSI